MTDEVTENDFWINDLLVGRTEPAQYQKTGLARYDTCENPCLDALAPIPSDEQIVKLIQRPGKYLPSERELPSHLRLHAVLALKEVVVALPHHLTAARTLVQALFGNYEHRNPYGKRYFRDLPQSVARDATIRVSETMRYRLLNTSILGLSGLGKTTFLEVFLLCIPQVLKHTFYAGRKFPFRQLVWLKLDCPHDGGLRMLCVRFFRAVDTILGSADYESTNYEQLYASRSHSTIESMIPHIAHVCSLHAIGLIVIDEIQHLNLAAADGDEKMLNFFVTLENGIGVPVVPVGTFAAMKLFGGQVRTARRMAGLGDFCWEPVKPGKEWDLFANGIWRLQYTKTETPLSPVLSERLADESQRVPDFAVKIYILAQCRAFYLQKETMTPALIHSVAKDSLNHARPFLRAMRESNFRALELYDDAPKFDLQKAIDALRNRQVLTIGAQANVPAQEGKPDEPKKRDAVHATRSPEQDPASLVTIGERAAGGDGYPALKAAGFIKDPAEFVPVEQ